jgi:predicted peptidase
MFTLIHMKSAPLLALILLLPAICKAQDTDLFERQMFIVGEDTLRCRILTPLNYTPARKYPLLVFLHGSGERGRDNEAQLTWGSSLFLDSATRVRYPAIVVFPQCPTDDYWATIKRAASRDSLGGFGFDTLAAPNKSLELVFHFIDTLLAHGGVDPQRVYLGGLSMGGFGTFEALWRRPDLFAAAFPICGGGSPEKVRQYRALLPIWIFHGDADPVVPVTLSRNMIPALKAAKAKLRYTEYPQVGHDSWKNTFAEPELLSWLFSQRKTSGGTKR